ncbi:MAG TPA: ATP-binding protein, partial [Hanamia sp.]|nr:ATP-binding protein [Hanamia sp.]
WWAYIIYILIALALVRWYFVYREKMIRTKQSLSFEKREALRLKEVDEVKDRFFSNITHEFRTPLTLIITPLEKLIQDNHLPASVVQTLKTIQKNSHQLLRLINEFLDFSKVNSGQMKVRLSSGELCLFVSDCVKRFNAGALDKNIKLSFLSEGVEGFYLFDEEKWEKIITNLLSNALKFTPQNGVVSLSLAAVGDEKIRLEVKDNGPGIPADQQAKIFERFYQADSSAIRNYSGTGIGLSLVKELILLMNGTIELDSIRGKYSRFIVDLPVQKGHATGTTITPLSNETTLLPEAKQNEQDGPLIMIVEDNEELRSFLEESMRTKYRVIATADGLQAWEMILHELPDIVISDVMMPGRDGFDLCHLCKSDKRTAHIGFILLTSKAAHDAQIKGLQTGADDYITKPFHLDELELRIVNLLRLQQKTRLRLQEQIFTATPQKTLPLINDAFLEQLYKEMDAKIDDPELDVDYLSKTMAMSRSTLNRKLKSLLDISPNGLIRQYRLQKATGYLSSGLDISSAAYKVGFSSPSYFSQCFREQYGISPSDYVLRQN